MRTINDRFISDLQSGELSFFLNVVRNNTNKYSLDIRENAINIYYRGGSIVQIEQKKTGYTCRFDINYLKRGEKGPELSPSYNTLCRMGRCSPSDIIPDFDLMRAEMDGWFAEHPKEEREFQQELQAANPCVVDIEHQYNYDRSSGMRFDMIIVIGDKLYVTENKVGINAIGGAAGVASHYQKTCEFLDSDTLLNGLIASVIETSEIKYKLGLTKTRINHIDPAKTELLFIFKDYNTKSHSLKNAVARINGSMHSYKKAYKASYIMLYGNNRTISIGSAKDLYTYRP